MDSNATLAVGWLAALLLAALHLRTRRRLVLVARATHEVRGPLTAARLGLHGLAGEPARLTAIDLELQRAGRALDDLTAGGRGEWHAQPVDVAGLARASEPVWRSLAAAHGARLELTTDDPDATVQGDPLRLAQACANLVANAAEHGGGLVRVRVRAAAGDGVRIEVSDDGPGLPAPVAALVAGARGRSGRRGHGLAVATAIAAHHGGRLSAAPSPTGARLSLELPSAIAAHEAAA